MDRHQNARLGFGGRVCLVQRVLGDGWSGRRRPPHFMSASGRSGSGWRVTWRATWRSSCRRGAMRSRDRTPRYGRPPRRRSAGSSCCGRSARVSLASRIASASRPRRWPARSGAMAWAACCPSRRRRRSFGTSASDRARCCTWITSSWAALSRGPSADALRCTQRTDAAMLAQHGFRHLRARPYAPRTNGKAERLIQTALREWAYVKPYRSSATRTGAPAPSLTSYNIIRPHTAHGRKLPISRLGL